MSLTRRQLLGYGVAMLPLVASAQALPKGRPVRLVVPYAAGGTTDIVARLIAASLANEIGQPVVVDNRPGGGGTIALAGVASAPADGLTLLVGGLEISVAPSLVANQEYLAKRDLTGVSGLTQGPLVLVVNPEKTPVTNLDELLAEARRNPGSMTFASAGIGNVTHLFGEIFKRTADVDILHVPYRGAAPALTDLQAGQVTMMMAGTGSVRPFIESGKLRALAVTGPDAAQAGVGDVPTFAQAGLAMPDTDLGAWTAIFAPRGTPAATIQWLDEKVQAVLQQPEVRSRLASSGLMPLVKPADELSAHLISQTQVWGDLITQAGITAN